MKLRPTELFGSYKYSKAHWVTTRVMVGQALRRSAPSQSTQLGGTTPRRNMRPDDSEATPLLIARTGTQDAMRASPDRATTVT
jgi:hypothetical protein